MKVIAQEQNLDVSGAFELLAQMPAESVWLANFTSENTRTAYQYSIAEFIATLGLSSSDDLYAVTQAHIIAYRQRLRDLGRSNNTISKRLSALSSLYKFLVDKQLVPANPVSGVKRPKTQSNGLGSGKTATVSKKGLRAILAAPDTSTLKGLRDRAIIATLFLTGARCSEPASLKVSDFYLDGDYWVLRFTTKGEKTNVVAFAEAETPENSELFEAIREYLDAAGHGNEPNSPLFRAVKTGRNNGGALRRMRIYEIFKTYARVVGLPENITPHSARATFITQAFEAGVSGEDIQRTVAHSSITTTETYNQSAKKHSRSAALTISHYS